jgi:hypothetical protein
LITRDALMDDLRETQLRGYHLTVRRKTSVCALHRGTGFDVTVTRSRDYPSRALWRGSPMLGRRSGHWYGQGPTH